MSSDFKTALAKRRSYYDINSDSPVSDAEVRGIVEYALLNTPSSFNSQSARVVLLFGQEHRKLWDIVREALRRVVPAASFKSTDDKMNSFAAGHGTVLFFEDQAVIRKLQTDFPLYARSFPYFSENSAGMLQLAVWVMLRDVGLGATLQHYSNLIHKQVAETWNLPMDWLPIAQMPFGGIVSEPEPREEQPLDTRFKVFP